MISLDDGLLMAGRGCFVGSKCGREPCILCVNEIG